LLKKRHDPTSENGLSTTIPQGHKAGGTSVNGEDESDSPEAQDGLLRIATEGRRRIQFAAIKNRREKKGKRRGKSIRDDEEPHCRDTGRAHRTLLVRRGSLRFPARRAARVRDRTMTSSGAAAWLIAHRLRCGRQRSNETHGHREHQHQRESSHGPLHALSLTHAPLLYKLRHTGGKGYQPHPSHPRLAETREANRPDGIGSREA
jgi:hypothetical protein